jgi:hypothetical protein
MTSDELRSPFILTLPMSWQTFILRTLIVSPERIADPAEMEAWKRTHPVEDQPWYRKAPATKRDNYGVLGRTT